MNEEIFKKGAKKNENNITMFLLFVSHKMGEEGRKTHTNRQKNRKTSANRHDVGALMTSYLIVTFGVLFIIITVVCVFFFMVFTSHVLCFLISYNIS